MVNCPCKSRPCSCSLEGDGGITFAGNGGGRQPYVPGFALWDLVGVTSSQAEVTVTGTGTVGDPWVVSVDTLGGSVVQTIYLGDDTWVKGGGTVAHVVVIGGGGGGGTTPTAGRASGGSGGAGGAMSVAWLLVDDLPDTVDLKVGQGGAPGQPVSGLTTGGDGGESWFGDYLYAGGGKGGKNQALDAQTQYPTLGGTAPDGGEGGAGAVRDGALVIGADDHLTLLSPTGGGNGEGATVADSPGGILAMHGWAGEGGAGGTSIPGGFANPGEDGNIYGGGGGGGGVSTIGTGHSALTPGGEGAQGIVVVTVW